MESALKTIFQKIHEKASFLTKLAIPLRFKKRDPTHTKDGHIMIMRAPSTFGDLPEPQVDWEGRLKHWKQMQTSQGTIKSFTERKAEIWDSGILSILSLL